MFVDPQVQHCGMVETVQHPVIGALRQLSSPLRMQGMEHGALRFAPPLRGQHSRDVLAGHVLDAARIDMLLREGIVATAAGKTSPCAR